jgi:hypothetical protein
MIHITVVLEHIGSLNLMRVVRVFRDGVHISCLALNMREADIVNTLIDGMEHLVFRDP